MPCLREPSCRSYSWAQALARVWRQSDLWVPKLRSAFVQGSYTVFGHEVNIANRLESASGHGRIFISQATLEHLQRDDPALAATCQPLPPISIKGIRAPVPVFEVPVEIARVTRLPSLDSFVIRALDW